MATQILDTTRATQVEKGKLQRHFRRFDMFFYLICTVVTIDTIGAVASNGAQGFAWLLFLALLFFLPYALIVAELGSAFPQEGGQYVWSRLAFGRLLSCVNSVIYWVSNPIWVGGSLTIVALATIGEFFTPLTGISKYLFALAFIWFTIGTAIISLRYGKWVPTVGAWARGAVLGFFTISVIVYAARHGVHGFGAGDFSPTYAVFIAAVPVLFFNFAGLEVPSAAGEEMTNPRRDVPFAVLWSGLATVLAYGIPILGILIVLPRSQIFGLTGFIDAAKAVFTVYGGHVAGDGTVTLTGAGKVLGLTISTTTISYLFIFPALVRLRYTYPDVERPYRVPGGMAVVWILSVLTTFWALLATVALIWPGFGVNWFGQHANPNDALDALSFSHERLQYELSQIVPLIVLIAVGVVFYLLGRTTREQTVDMPAGPHEARPDEVAAGLAR
jgi:amino acid transporter